MLFAILEYPLAVSYSVGSDQTGNNLVYLGPVVQSMVSLLSLLMTNSLTAVAKVFSNTFIFLLQK